MNAIARLNFAHLPTPMLSVIKLPGSPLSIIAISYEKNSA